MVIPPSAANQQRAQQALALEHGHSSGAAQVVSFGKDAEEEDVVDLLYDPTLNCYYEPRTGKYYELSMS
ncbi:hypothetical protein T492DRAFT_879912 [Pavlovales sp. CCMP2436]|nr:hypothetical protein T492DRAFT_879912 [Pavlovales sp. CCMP2436]